jgi:hypothetical protein
MSRAVVWIALLLACLSSTTAHADDDETGGQRRMLGGHMFIPSLVVIDPFVSTYAGGDIGTGYSWIDGPSFDPTGRRTGTGSFNAAAIAQGAELQLGLAHWFALRLTGGGGLDGGNNAR